LKNTTKFGTAREKSREKFELPKTPFQRTFKGKIAGKAQKKRVLGTFLESSFKFLSNNKKISF